LHKNERFGDRSEDAFKGVVHINWLKKFMNGRYGTDQLSMALLIFSIVLTLISELSRLPILSYISLIPLALCIFRLLSKKLEKRRLENYKFAMLISPVYSWFMKTLSHSKKARTHKMFKCPECKAGLWVPKGKGEIIITCSKCKKEIRAKT
jgi:hypothetical protein